MTENRDNDETLPDPPCPSAWSRGEPERIVSYLIIREIVRGGMGVVYEAEQEKPRRTVALKIITQAALSREVLSRFDFEAQVLGRLQHPGIAQIFEAGRF